MRVTTMRAKRVGLESKEKRISGGKWKVWYATSSSASRFFNTRSVTSFDQNNSNLEIIWFLLLENSDKTNGTKTWTKLSRIYFITLKSCKLCHAQFIFILRHMKSPNLPGISISVAAAFFCILMVPFIYRHIQQIHSSLKYEVDFCIVSVF